MKGGLEPTSLFSVALRHSQAAEFLQAVRLYREILVCEPELVEAHINLGCALIPLGAYSDAVASLRQAIRLRPQSPEAHSNLGLALQHQGDMSGAAAAFRQALALAPAYADALYNMGNLFLKQDALDDAACCYRQVLEIEPGHADALFNLGNILLYRRQLEDAIAHYRHALTQKPGLARAQFNLASALCQADRVEEGFAAFTAYAKRVPRARPVGATLPHKLRHDQEQQTYLGADAGAPAVFRIDAGAALPSAAVNPVNAAKAAEDWRRSRPQMAVIDDFLTPGALAALRQFCRASTIWHRVHADGYVGAMPEDGFACPLMAQIARELRDVFPEILGPHLFKRLAAFKYDSQFAGLGLHADTAAVNVNFWISDDDANLDLESGGMVIWDVPAPLNWAHATYNGDAAACRDFLEMAKSNPTAVPHRSNRAVIFDSDLFHETDRIVFKSGYLNRRTSISMLYGERGD